MIRDILRTLSGLLADSGHDGPIKLRLPASAFAALLAEMRVEVPAELERGARRSVRIGNVEVVE